MAECTEHCLTEMSKDADDSKVATHVVLNIIAFV